MSSNASRLWVRSFLLTPVIMMGLLTPLCAFGAVAATADGELGFGALFAGLTVAAGALTYFTYRLSKKFDRQTESP